MLYLSAIVLTPGGSSTVHIYTQTVHETTQLTNQEVCGPCSVFASYTSAFALHLRNIYIYRMSEKDCNFFKKFSLGPCCLVGAILKLLCPRERRVFQS
jgi:hypothetical protein